MILKKPQSAPKMSETNHPLPTNWSVPVDTSSQPNKKKYLRSFNFLIIKKIFFNNIDNLMIANFI